MAADNLAPLIINRLGKEINSLKRRPPGGFTYIESENDTMSEIHAQLIGPECTPFFGGKFRLKLVITTDYPTSAPKGYFLTKIFHPNVAPETGDICVNSLKRDWKPETTITEILQVIRCLIIEPNPESALNEEAGKLFMESYEEYSRKAKILTEVHATSEEEENIAVDHNNTTNTNTTNDNSKDGSGNNKSTSNSDSNDIAKVKGLIQTAGSSVSSNSTTEVSKEVTALQKVKDAKKKSLKRL